MNRCYRLASLLLLLAAVPAFAHNWNINSQKVEGDFVKESNVDVGGKKVAVVILAVGSDMRSYPARAAQFRRQEVRAEAG